MDTDEVRVLVNQAIVEVLKIAEKATNLEISGIKKEMRRMFYEKPSSFMRQPAIEDMLADLEGSVGSMFHKLQEGFLEQSKK